MESPILHIDLAVPQGWHELSDKQLRYAFELIAKGFTSDELKTLCLFRWSGLKVRHRHNAEFVCRLRKQTFRLTALQIAELLCKREQSGACSGYAERSQQCAESEVIPALDWLDIIPPQPVCISRIGRYRPFAADFSEVAFEKFIICDNLYQGYLATQRDDLLDQLASILYNHNLSPHNLSPAHRVSVFYWFASVKDLFARQYPNFFQTASQPDNLLGGSRLPTGAQIQQAVNTMIRALTKGDITKEREILSLDTHRALTELDAQAKEYKEINKTLPKK